LLLLRDRFIEGRSLAACGAPEALQAARGGTGTFGLQDTCEGRWVGQYRADKSVDFARLTLDVDFERSVAHIAHRTGKVVVGGDVEDPVTETDTLHPPGQTHDFALDHAAFNFAHRRGEPSFAQNGAGMDDDASPERVAAAMYERDRAAHAMGIELLEVRAGFARLAFNVRDDMLNGYDMCHGGFVFALADTAFAYACNSRNRATVALQCAISYVAPARAGERLIATAQERALGGRTGTYDVEVQRADGTVLAFFRGTSYRVNASVM